MKKTHIFQIIILSLLLNTTIHNAHSFDTAINGFISQGYLKTDKNNFQGETEKKGSFQFNEMGIKFSSMVSNNLFIGMQFFARDLGNLGNDEITLDWAYADYIINNAIGVRAGIIKIPYGFYNESRDSDIMRASIFLPNCIYSEPWRDSLVSMKGMGLYGTLFNYFSYQLQTGGSQVPLDGGIAKQFMGIVDGQTTSFTTENFSIANFQISDIIDGLRFGFCYYYWKFNLEVDIRLPATSGQNLSLPASSEGDINTWIAGVEYTYNRLTISAEYSIFKYDAPIEVELFPMSINLCTNAELYYINLSYQLTDFFTIGTYYSSGYADKNDRDGKKWEKTYQASGFPAHSAFSKDTCISLRIDINPYWILKLEGHYFEGTAAAFITDNKDENGKVDLEKYWKLFAVKVMFVF